MFARLCSRIVGSVGARSQLSQLYTNFKRPSLASQSTTEKRFTRGGLTLSSLSALVQFPGEVCVLYLALGNTLRRKSLLEWSKSLVPRYNFIYYPYIITMII